MELEKFKVFSIRQGGWVTPSGATSQSDRAQTFTLVEALQYCTSRFVDEHVCFPVSEKHLKAVKDGTR